MPFRWSLQKKMTSLLVAFGVIPLCLMGCLLIAIGWNAHVSKTVSRQASVLDNIEADYLMLRSQTENVIRALANVEALSDMTSSRSAGDWIARWKEEVHPELSKAEFYLAAQDARILLIYDSDVFNMEAWYQLLNAERFASDEGYQSFLTSGGNAGWYGMSPTVPEPLHGLIDYQNLGERFTYYCRVASPFGSRSNVIKCAVGSGPFLEAARQRAAGNALYVLAGDRILYAADEQYESDAFTGRNGDAYRWNGSLWQKTTLEDMGLSVVIRTEIRGILADYLLSNGGMLALVFLTITLLFFVAHRVLRGMLERLRRVAAAADSINAADGPVHLPEEGEDEVGHVVRAFNSLFDRLDLQMEEMISKEKAKRHMQALALQYQLNPHFLFNSLQWLQMELENRDVDQRVCGNITKLGSVLRYNLSESLDATLAQEMEQLRAYIGFMCDMKRQTIELKLEWAPELDDMVIPRFMLQPLVENALQHGLIHGVDMTVSLRVEQQGEMIRFRLANNGKMIAPSRLEQMRETLEHPELSSSGRVGIANLAQRLKLKYPNRHSIQVSSEPGETVFVIEIPAEKRSR